MKLENPSNHHSGKPMKSAASGQAWSSPGFLELGSADADVGRSSTASIFGILVWSWVA
jgi:hypothetical protein